MDLYLYTIYYRKNDVVKNVSSYTKLEGSLKYPTNELNPIIRITLKNQTELPRYTYAYIPEFRRYYFIENIQAFSSELFDLYMHVDVLMTYIGNDNAILRASNFYIERNDYDYNEFYVDDRLPRKINNNVTYKEIANASQVSPDLLNLNTSSRNYLLVLLTDLDTRTLLGESSVTSPSYFPNPVDAKEIKGRATNYKMGYVSYILTYEQALLASYYILVDDTFKSLVVSFTVFPFDLRLGSNYALVNDQGKIVISKSGVVANQLDLTALDSNIDKNIYGVQTPVLSFNLFNNTIGVIKSNINNGVEFYNYGQYSKYELYVPYVGFVDINWDLIQNADDNDRFRVQLATNVQTGESSILILIGGIPYKTFKVKIGVEVNLSSSNANENARKQDSINMQEIGSAVVSGLMLVGGAVLSVVGGGAGVPMMIGGAGSMVGSMASLEAQRNQIISYGQTGTSSSVEGLLGLQKFVWRITEPNLETSLYLSNIWTGENGRPCKKVKNAQSIKGYAEFGKNEFRVGNVLEEKELEELTQNGVHFPEN